MEEKKKMMSMPCIQSVLKHMEANQRIELSQRCPDLQEVDKNTPLLIDTLALHSTRLEINGTIYRVGIIPRFPNGRYPTLTESLQLYGGYPCDINEYGIRSPSTNHIILPGDVLIPPINHCDENFDGKEGGLKKVAQLEFKIQKGNNNQESLEYMNSTIEFLKCRIAEEPANFERYLQYSVTKPNGDLKAEVVEYNKKVYETMKIINEKILGGRILIVRMFQPVPNGSVLRLPENLKISMKSLEIGMNVDATMNALDPLIDPDCYPLDHLKCSDGGDDYKIKDHVEDYMHPIFKSAKFLHLDPRGEKIFDLILNAENPRIRLDSFWVTCADLITLAEKYLEDEKFHGRFFEFGYRIAMDPMSFLGALEARQNQWTVKKTEVEFFSRLHINDELDLCIKLEKIPAATRYEVNFLLKFETGPRVEKMATFEVEEPEQNREDQSCFGVFGQEIQNVFIALGECFLGSVRVIFGIRN